MKCVAFALLLLVPAVLGNHLPFRATLYDMNGEFYELMWGFSVEDETIDFTVNVSTTGWVGFGLSPNGDMRNSDVVIGWVDDSGQAFFHDRFADERALPPVDDQQDWVLTEGQEADGFTTLSFTRPWVTCDERDRDIVAQTARVVFSWNDADPVNNDENRVLYHGTTARSSATLNLLGGNPDPPPEPEDSDSFFIGVENFTIPSQSTTYWCVTARLPDDVFSGTNYIYRYSPAIVSANTAFVHHIIVYQCSSLVNATEGTGRECRGQQEVDIIAECTQGGVTIAGWAVGGEDFVYPRDVAQQFTGRESDGQFVVIEMHYDNPNNAENVVDNSGIRFFYTGTPPEKNAGIFTIAAQTDQRVIIPPNTPNFTVSVRCSAGCLERFIPQDGLTVFANTFHTHTAGHGLVLERYRTNPTCGVLEEIEPIEQNLLYDFNYQQQNTLPNEIKIYPGDSLVLKCFYDTTDRSGVTLGGEATSDEMCISFLNYYPVNSDTIAFCTNIVLTASYSPFIDRNVPSGERESFEDFQRGVDINLQNRNIALPSATFVRETFDTLDWTDIQREDFQNSLVYSDSARILDICGARNADVEFSFNISALPDARCTYHEPNVCTNTEPVPCCERLGAPGLAMSFMLVLAMLLLAAAMV